MSVRRIVGSAYYGLLALVLIIQVIFTVYQTSLVVSHGRDWQRLQQDKLSLSQEKLQLQSSLATQLSLNQLKTHSTTHYLPIRAPLVVKVSSTVASR